MNIKHILTIVFIIFVFTLSAQLLNDSTRLELFIKRIDSLESKLPEVSQQQQIRILSQLSSYYLLTDPKKSLALGLQAKEMAIKNNDQTGEIIASRSIINSYLTGGLFEEALKHQKRLLEKIENSDRKELTRKTIFDIGVSYLELGVLDSSLFHFNKAYHLADKFGTNYEKAMIFYYKAFPYTKMGKIKKAIECYLESYTILEKIPDTESFVFIKSKDGIAGMGVARLMDNCINNIGDAYEKLELYDKALNYYQKAYNNYLKKNDLEGLVVSYMSFANIAKFKGNYIKSLNWMQKAIETAISIHPDYRLSEIYGYYYDIYQQKRDYKNALQYYKKYSESINDVRIKERREALSKIESGHEIDKKMKENEILANKNQIQTLMLENEKSLRVFLLSGIVLVLALFGVLFSRYRLKMIANKNIVTLSKIGKDITSILDIDRMLLTFYEDSNTLMRADAFGIGIFQPESGQIEFKFVIEEDVRKPDFFTELDRADSFGVWCYNNKQEIFLKDIDSEYSQYLSEKPANILDSRIKSAIYLPLVNKDKILGVVTVQSFRKNSYIEQHLNMLKTLSSYLAIALDNSNVYEQLNKLNRELVNSNNLLFKEQQQSEKLLLNVLPAKVAADLKEKGKSDPETFDNVTVFFSDVCDFTEMTASLEPNFVITELNDIVSNFDRIFKKNGCERIKTIGDAYLAVCGMPEESESHIDNIIQSAIESLEYLQERNRKNSLQWNIRIGIHTGVVVGGVVGVEKYIYDVFGDTINVAFRMEQQSQAMMINISEYTKKLVENRYEFIEREEIFVKGKGHMKMYFLKV